MTVDDVTNYVIYYDFTCKLWEFVGFSLWNSPAKSGSGLTLVKASNFSNERYFNQLKLWAKHG